MTAVVATLAVVVVLLAMLVAGLLRSHAEILRRLSDLERPATADARTGSTATSDVVHLAPGVPPVPDRAPSRTSGHDIAGVTPAGDAVKVSVRGGRPTLLAFLSSGCLTCASFWDAFDPRVREPLPGDTRLVIVTRDPSRESPATIEELSPADVPVVMSSEAWTDYDVPVSPYFVLVDGRGSIDGEGAAERWPQVLSLLRDALRDRERERADAAGNGAPSKRPRTDEELQAAGIGKDHPSLYAADDPNGRA